jgi:hypothetical protein
MGEMCTVRAFPFNLQCRTSPPVTMQMAMPKVAWKAPESVKEALRVVMRRAHIAGNAKLPTTDVYPRPVRGDA